MFMQIIRKLSKSCPPPKPKCPKTTSVPRCPEPKDRKLGPSECIVGPSGVYPPHEGGYKMWKNLSLYICLPMIAFAAYNTFSCNPDEPEPERPKFIPLEYMRRRTRQFCWGGGGPTDKSFFHNPEVNALSDGYEDEKKPEG